MNKENEIKGNINIYFNGIFDYIRDKDFEIIGLHNDIKRLNNIVDDYKSSNEKAIEYIKKRTEEYNNSDKITRACINDYHYKILIDELFKILNNEELKEGK